MKTEFNDITCPECGAGNKSAGQLCWLCHASLHPEQPRTYQGPLPPVRLHRPQPGASSGASFSLATLMLLMTLGAVFCGMLSLGAGLAIPAMILSVPVLIRTMMVVERRKRVGLDVGPMRKTLLFVGSFATAAVMMTVVAVAAIGTFCGVCLSAASMADRPGSSGPFFIAVIAALSVLALIGLGFARWMAARWDRDTSR